MTVGRTESQERTRANKQKEIKLMYKETMQDHARQKEEIGSIN